MPDNQQAAEFLTRVRKRIEKPENWTQGAAARIWPKGSPVSVSSPRAKCWCLAGATFREASAYPLDAASEAENKLYRMAEFDVAFWNDTHTHAEVLALLDEAIEELRK